MVLRPTTAMISRNPLNFRPSYVTTFSGRLSDLHRWKKFVFLICSTEMSQQNAILKLLERQGNDLPQMEAAVLQGNFFEKGLSDAKKREERRYT